MPRLIHLNGPPGIGKSTLAQLYTGEHPGVLNLDIDQLRALVHAGDRYTKIRVTFVPAGTPSFSRAAKAGMLGAFKNPEPALLATISDGPSADRVLGFVVGMLTRHAKPLGVSGVGIPLSG